MQRRLLMRLTFDQMRLDTFPKSKWIGIAI